MNKKVRHVLGISGGKDSAALAIYMKDNYPRLDIEYYTTDTGKELDETYQLIDNLEIYLGKEIIRLEAANKSHQDPFDHYFEIFGRYLPRSDERWCTRTLKLEPFEAFVGDDLVVSYVGIRGDEDREGYISKKDNIQSIFPFRQNIWSKDVIRTVFAEVNKALVKEYYTEYSTNQNISRILEILDKKTNDFFSIEDKAKLLLDIDTVLFNHVVHRFLQLTERPLSQESDFPLISNTDILVKDDIFRILRESGVGVPAYYEPIPFEIDGIRSTYSRSRSGCYFCFFQQKIEWVWLLEQHPDRFAKAVAYEQEGCTWMDEKLTDLAKPERVAEIKREYLKRKERQKKNEKINSKFLRDTLFEESEGCIACFV
ncbi:phosphoadenosine phosphosulfate reductase family protein [Parapedobacter sp. ISTM3]|uniref:phosphoadenosine phosphosulfate reductase family protein n=1 Tax=Parapedobacter sp. ISTM3 TaxID=2800130 RepID=UPI001907578A|nr:phosphoadenosine phosphosulfate reductase family protein [Parapedobacter sp. ISTM3]MBK1442682.1 phosphoadenosine phosphosulfate reductase family protein [Parapedobacter sp. ISTM3]